MMYIFSFYYCYFFGFVGRSWSFLAWFLPRFPLFFSRLSRVFRRGFSWPPSVSCRYVYKITKIVRSLWLVERSVCMRECKHGCGVKMFCFSRAYHASTNLKTFSSSKLDKFTLFTHSFVGWNVENCYKEGESIFLCLSWHFKREKSVFCKASFGKTRTGYARKTSWTRFCDW